VTAVITSTFVTRATRDYEAAHATEQVSDREWIEQRFETLERKLDQLTGVGGNSGACRRSGTHPDD